MSRPRGDRTGAICVRRVSLRHPDVAPLLARLDHELAAVNPEGGTNFTHLGHHEVEPGSGGFFVARVDGVARGCGGYRAITGAAGAAEVKRMWVDPAARGTGIGAGVLRAIIDAAVADGYSELRLETGLHLQAAVALYRRFGFEECAPWGDYVGVPLSYCMSRQLD